MSRSFDEKVELASWQRRLLPWAIGLLIGLAIFFLVSSWIQFDRLSAAMQKNPDDHVARTFTDYEKQLGKQDIDYLKWKTIVLLERNTVDHRYRQVNATLLLRTWTRHLGFLTGMILSFIGGIFILTKLSEKETQLGAESGSLKGNLATSSPGIVLTVVGGTIMIVTLVTEYRFSTNDAPAYVGTSAAPGRAEDAAPLPMLEDENSRQTEEKELFADGNAEEPR